MRFLLDQNTNVSALRPLQLLFTEHEFETAFAVGLGDADDIELFHLMPARGYHAIITRDRNQLANPEERGALRSQGLHWIGYKQPDAPGLHGLSLETATIVTGLPHVLDALDSAASAPSAFRLKGIPRERGQRLITFPL